MKQLAYVLTHHWVPNFGANLQAFAVRRALDTRGLDVSFVDFRPPDLVKKYQRTVSSEQRAAHEAFVAEHLPLTDRVSDQTGFRNLCRRSPADVYVTGSDAVFRVSASSMRADLSFPNPYWLVGVDPDSGQKPLRVAISPSAMGAKFAEMAAPVRAEMRAALEAMDHLSARDSWTAAQIASLGCSRQVTPLADPVFLLADIIRGACARPFGRPYIAICTQQRCSPAWIRSFTKIADAEGFDTVAIPTPEGTTDRGAGRTTRLPLKPDEWLSLHANASGYIGVRFHPVVVSLAAGLPVVALDLYHRHPFSRAQSKTWHLMRSFANASACHSQIMHRYLTPTTVWRQLARQMDSIASRRSIADSLAATLDTYLTDAIGPPRRASG